MENNFEQKLGELEKIAQKLSEGNQPLEQSLQEFERAIRLSKECNDILQKAEQRVKLLLQKEDGTWEEQNNAPAREGN